ncbi:alanine--tRNA ligase [uncultured Microscilla sp.]|uniref:alanine--tRNA ligase n=1 Tax=uncultured Microscilla sp. TaxID=432653 RepID=UPI0026248660|nr:alanine--tRNA ligase [uncultured Microscilla sp.]
MDSKTIRQKFLDFFREKQHQIVDSAPLVVKNDPTLMFTNAGMNQFKDFFLGTKTAENRRVADTQKCLRVSGKHNDLEEVGHDTYHHTMFEMLGNWSFGDYFKKEAIAWAWELLTGVFELPKDRLYVTVFEGDKEDNLEPDQEAFDIWKNYINEDRIIYASKKDNFWEMGETGPCGPCSEIHIDLRDAGKVAKTPGKGLVNQDDPQVVEIWNLVFIQFNRMANKSLQNLPDKHVDTGMGFERLAMAIQGKKSNYDTDVFQPMIQSLAKVAGTQYGKEEKTDIALRVIADHIRAISFAITDGQLPGNNGAGYVIRRILRRAVRYGYSYLGFNEPFLHTLVPMLAEQFAEVFPELKQQQAHVSNIIIQEEKSFLRTLANGLKLLDEVIAKTKGQQQKEIAGTDVFTLSDRYGFPSDLTNLVASENGLGIDEKGFKEELKKQKERSQKDAQKSTGDWVVLNSGESEFIGYDETSSFTKVLRYREIEVKKKKQYEIVLETTPFYAESGGQVGDTGSLEFRAEAGTVTIPVIDTKKENDLIIHYSPKNDFTKVADLAQVEVFAQVKEQRRRLTENNHSATHLVHSALRQVLGQHVEQRGSLVNDAVLRFDFSHNAKMTDEEIAEVERIVNEKIRENIALDERRAVPYKEAIESLGATGLFGEKYGDTVRVITFDENYSRELCGGCHVPSTGVIGFFKIMTETSVASGVRRIEAVTATKAEEYVQNQVALVNQVKDLLKNPKDLPKAIESLIKEKTDLSKQIEVLENQQVQALKQGLLDAVKQTNGINFIAQKVSLPSADALKNLAFDVRKNQDNLFMVLASDIKGKPQIAVMISDNLVKEKSLNAGKIVKELAREIKGGGGGQAFFATAGGKDATGLDKVVERAGEFVA